MADWTQIAEIVKSGSVTIIIAFLWWTERADRRAAEERERQLLRDFRTTLIALGDKGSES